jgi:methionyl-tRNA formyltransferase
MGTPDFAVASLDALVQEGYNIVGVITAPDKPAGRGMKLTGSAVKNYSVEKGLHILQPEKLKNSLFIEALQNLNADIQIVVAFRMLPEIVWNMPSMGTVNLHGSLLPQYRGAAPINWAIINGEKETGVTTFKLQHDIDTGNILLQEPIPIGDDETASELHDRMKLIGAALVVKTVNGLAEGLLQETPQIEFINGAVNASDRDDQKLLASRSDGPRLTGVLKHAPKIYTETCKIDWNKNIDQVYDLIRGLSTHPGAFTYLDGKMLKIFRAQKEKTSSAFAPGTYETDKKNFLRFTCNDGAISLKELQLEGKKKMGVEEFLRGYHHLLQKNTR